MVSLGVVAGSVQAPRRRTQQYEVLRGDASACAELARLGCPRAGPALCPLDTQPVPKVHVHKDTNLYSETLIERLEQKRSEYGVQTWADVSHYRVRRNTSRKTYDSLTAWKFSSLFGWSVRGLWFLEGKKLSVWIGDSQFSAWGKSPSIGKDDSKQTESKKPKI